MMCPTNTEIGPTCLAGLDRLAHQALAAVITSIRFSTHDPEE